VTPQERNARAYCLSIGANPDEPVSGYPTPSFFWFIGDRQWVEAPRWCWYVGAKIQHHHAAE
jgi:hypothetical protein